MLSITACFMTSIGYAHVLTSSLPHTCQITELSSHPVTTRAHSNEDLSRFTQWCEVGYMGVQMGVLVTLIACEQA
jgi:hypothetical protein